MWRKFRIAVLLFVLATVAHRAWLQEQHLHWIEPIHVALFPINVDGNVQVTNYIANLDNAQFEPVADFLAEEAQRHGLGLSRPFELRLGSSMDELPPRPPQTGNMLQVIMWSLHFRWWAWRHSPTTAVPADMQLYLLYHDPGLHKVLPHSTALNKGRLGMINVYADSHYESQNAVVVTHELLHAVGATDKYDFTNNQPLYPHGYAEPYRQPVYPQALAEIMGGRVPISQDEAEIPSGLSLTLIGDMTAAEIGWFRDKL